MKNVFTIPKKITAGDDLVVLPRTEYEKILNRGKKDKVTEEDVLRWSREAKELKRQGKMRTFEGFIKEEYPSLAKKHNI